MKYIYKIFNRMGILVNENCIRLFVKILVLALISTSLLVCTADQVMGSGSKPLMAPINPDYLDFLNLTKNENNEFQTGFIPPKSRISNPSDGSGMMKSAGDFPASYDLRDFSRVTSVKDQKSWGTCWAHAAMSSLESNLLPDENWDFSEKNLVNRNLIGTTPDSGGNHYHSGGYFTAQLGPLSEANDPYPSGTWNYSSPSGPVEKNVYGIHWLPDKSSPTDLDFIKQSVMDYGALETTYYENHDWNNTFNSYYCPSANTINHAVTIVGWDDNFSRYKFTTAPPGDGALLIKNPYEASPQA